jgi:hypothetical protein
MRQRKARRRPSYRLYLEVLERRDLLAAPTAVADLYRVSPTDGSLTQPALNGLLINDVQNGGGGTLTVASHTSPAHGTLTVNSDGSFTYTPTSGFLGNDTFTYQCKDNGGTSGSATVTLEVNAPYPQSTFIKGMTWDYSSRQRLAYGSDLWVTTYDSDGNLYTSWGDGGGFGTGTNPNLDKVPTGMARITGNPPLTEPPTSGATAFNIWGGAGTNNGDSGAPQPYDPVYTDTNGKTVVIDTGLDGSGGGSPKPENLISVQDSLGNDVLVFDMNAPPGSDAYPGNELLYSVNHGATWTEIANSKNFPLPGLVYFGAGNTGLPSAVAGFVYGFVSAGGTGNAADDNQELIRMPVGDFSAANIASLGSHAGDVQYFGGLNGSTPIWTTASGAVTVISDVRIESLEVSYDSSIQRYLAFYSQNRPVNGDDTMIGSLTVLESANLWGPWSTAAEYNNWGGSTLAGATYQLGLTVPTKPGWLQNGITYSTSGSTQTFAAIFSGTGHTPPSADFDSFNLLSSANQSFLLYPTVPTNLTASGGNGQVTLHWSASPDAASYNIYRSTSSGSETLLTTGVTGTSFTNTGVTNGTTYYYKITAVNSVGESGKSNEASATPQNTGLPAGWTDQDIGSPGVAGSASFNGTTWTVNGGGADIAGTSDQFNFASESFTGDAIAVAKITSETNTNSSTKAGVMFRDGTAANAMFADVVVKPTGNIQFQWRPSTGATTSVYAGTPVSLPIWVKVVRTGNSFTGFDSTDGSTWTQIGSAVTIPMSTTALVGLAVTAHDNTQLATATFTNVAVTDNLSDADIGGPGLAGSASYSATTNTWTVKGGGADIAGTSDQFNFAFKSFTGDGVAFAEVTSETNTNSSTKAGVMFRDGTAANAMFADVVVKPTGNIQFQWRPSTGATTSVFAGTAVTLPIWVKVVRSGNTFTGFDSTDGTTWTQIGSAATSPMSSTALVGLAVTAHDNTQLATATFTNVDPEPLTGDAADARTPGVGAVPAGNTDVLASQSPGDGSVGRALLALIESPSPLFFPDSSWRPIDGHASAATHGVPAGGAGQPGFAEDVLAAHASTGPVPDGLWLNILDQVFQDDNG